MKAADTITVLKYFGICPIIRGTWHKFAKKSGLFYLRFPISNWDNLHLSNFAAQDITIDQLRETLKQTAFFPIKDVLKHKDILTEINTGATETIQRANNLAKGKFRFFSKMDIEVPLPIQWHQSPSSDAKWPNELHWCKINCFSKDHGDIKLTWELSRFSWSFDLVRAYALTSDSKYVQLFWDLFESWLADNQPNLGVNWVSGQECALRIMAWCFALFAFIDEDVTSNQRIEKLLLAIAVHCRRIEKFISHAIRQKTNHAMTEATAKRHSNLKDT